MARSHVVHHVRCRSLLRVVYDACVRGLECLRDLGEACTCGRNVVHVLCDVRLESGVYPLYGAELGKHVSLL